MGTGEVNSGGKRRLSRTLRLLGVAVKSIVKLAGALFLLAALCVGCLVAVIEVVRYRSQKEVLSIVAQLAPGTPFSVAVQRLGRPKQIYTNDKEIISWVERVGAHVEPGLATNSILHVFVHRGPPFRYILVYTDRESQRVVYADWCHM